MNKIITIREASKDDKEEIVRLTKDWEDEHITYGFSGDDMSYFLNKKCYCALIGNQVIGFIVGEISVAYKDYEFIKKNTPYFEIDELYIIPEERKKGYGSKLYEFTEQKLKEEKIKYIMLSSATKDVESVLNFYVKKERMNVHYVRLYKEIN